MEAFEHLLRDFCAEVGIAEADTVVMTSEIVVDGISIQLMAMDEDGEGLTLFADLGVPDTDRRGEVHRQLLEGNLLWNGTGGAVLGVHRATGAVGLSARVDLEGLTGKLLAEIVNRFVTVSEHWQAVVRGGTVGGGAVPGLEAMSMLRG